MSFNSLIISSRELKDMVLIRSLEELNSLREEIMQRNKRFDAPGTIQIIIGMSSCGIAAGALGTLAEINEQIRKTNLQNVRVSQTGCSGLCTHEPIVQLIMDGKHKFAYGKVSPAVVRRIFDEHIRVGSIVRENLIEL
jgi:NADP-reducing hydrogenase subunit HndB